MAATTAGPPTHHEPTSTPTTASAAAARAMSGANATTKTLRAMRYSPTGRHRKGT
jgi:hypothetical protein